MMLPSIFNERLFDDFMSSPFDSEFFTRNPLYGKHESRIMKTDVRQKDDGYEVMIDLPGFKKDNVNINLENGYLTVSASKSLEKDEGEEKKDYIRRERWAGNCSRSFYVGENVTAEDIKAKMEDGILTLNIPKKDKALPAKTQIMIEG